MTPAEVRAFNAGVEAMRALALASVTPIPEALRRRALVIPCMNAARRALAIDGAGLLLPVPERAPCE